jgi:pyridoxal phosphate enzyme (YggS family)
VIDSAALRARLAGVRERIARAAHRAGRDPASIRLVAVSKTFPPDFVRAAADAGQFHFGENRVQEALEKMSATSDLDITWHLVGHLQSNKARKAAERFDTIHSIDDADLLSKLEAGAQSINRKIELLIQIDLAGEATKFGVGADEIGAVLAAARANRWARVTGLMLMPPFIADPQAARPYFAALRRMRDQLAAQDDNPPLPELSMGMSHDFEVAIEEGATLVRVGTAIFGKRVPAEA